MIDPNRGTRMQIVTGRDLSPLLHLSEQLLLAGTSAEHSADRGRRDTASNSCDNALIFIKIQPQLDAFFWCTTSRGSNSDRRAGGKQEKITHKIRNHSNSPLSKRILPN